MTPNWLRPGGGVTVRESCHPEPITGHFKGVNFADCTLPPRANFTNHVEPNFKDWVTSQITAMVKNGAIKPVGKSGFDDDGRPMPQPHIVTPLSVEPTKPRLIFDGRPPNLFGRRVALKLPAVGTIPQLCRFGDFQATFDHKSGYYHVSIHPSEYEYFGFEWDGMYYVLMVLPFGWCEAPFVYQTLSDAVAAYVANTYHIPLRMYIDDGWLNGWRRWLSRRLPPTPRPMWRSPRW